MGLHTNLFLLAVAASLFFLIYYVILLYKLDFYVSLSTMN